MKKICLLLICLFMGIGSASAANITSSKYENGRISLKGTGQKQVQIVIFDKNNSPLYMTTSDASDGTFSITLPEIANLKDGNYVIKVADYDGKNVKSIDLEVKGSISSNNPNTYDNLVLYIGLFIISVGGIVTILMHRKKKASN